MHGKQTFLIGSSTIIENDWESVRKGALQVMGTNKWYTLQVVRRGYKEATSQPTMLIGVSDFQDPIWIQTGHQIRDLLNQTTLHLDIEFIQSEQMRSKVLVNPTALPISAFKKEAGLGSSLGPRDSTGTLGGYVLLSKPKTLPMVGTLVPDENPPNFLKPGADQEIFCITNYHVARTEQMTSCKQYLPLNFGFSNNSLDNDNYGIGDAKAANFSVSFHSPSQADVRCSIEAQEVLSQGYQEPIKRLGNRVKWGDLGRTEELEVLTAKNAQCEVDVTKMKDFDNFFGEFFAGGGFRKDEDGGARLGSSSSGSA